MAPPFTVALTGGIASGKTLVSDEFKELGVPVVDTDVIARQVVTPGLPALREIASAFGTKVIDGRGYLNRQYLRAEIFSDPDARKKLESILHPRIRQEAGEVIAGLKSDYCLLVIPLLAEHSRYPGIDRVLVVDVAPELQIRRLMSRDQCDQKRAEQILASQATREQRLSIADDVLDNSGSPGALTREVLQLHRKYRNLSLQKKY